MPEKEDLYDACIAACYECATACKQCADECLNEKDMEMLASCIKLDQDCSTMCLVAAIMMAGNSEFVERICTLCADVCEACAKECEKHAHMEHCKVCAEACKKCAAECRKIGKTAA